MPLRNAPYKDFRLILIFLNKIYFIGFTSGVDFTNILCSAFMHADPKSAKKTNGLTEFFAFLGSARVKADHKMLVKIYSRGL